MCTSVGLCRQEVQDAPLVVPELAQQEQLALQQQLRSLRTRMETAVQLNSSLEPALQLAPHELILNTALRWDHCGSA